MAADRIKPRGDGRADRMPVATLLRTGDGVVMASHSYHRRGMMAVVTAGLLGFAGCASTGVGSDATAGRRPDATVTLSMVSAAFLGSGSGGSGTLNFRGNTYRFGIGGAGIGGIGASTIEGTGNVYNLRDISQFPGAYGQVRSGFAFGDRSGGTLWLQNSQGVIMEIRAQRTGLMLSLGGDAVVITMTP